MFCAAPAACSLRSFPSRALQPPSLKGFLVLPVYCLSISGLICLLIHTVFLSPCTLTAACLFVCLPLLPLAPSPLRGLSCSEYGGDTSGASLYYLPANPVSLRISVSDSSLHLSLSQTSLSFAPLASPGYLLLSASLGASDSSVSPPSLPVPPSAQTPGGFCVSPSTAAFPYFSVTSQPYPWPFHLQDARLLLRATLCFGLT